MSIPYWVDPELGGGVASLWDFVWLGNVLWPGFWTVEIVKSRSVDVAKVKGQDAATLTDNGYDLASVKLNGRLWGQDQLDRFDQILPDFDPRRPGSVKSPIDIYYPSASLLGIKTIYIKSITVGTPSGQILPVSIDAIEWAKPTSAAKVVTGKNTPKGLDKPAAPGLFGNGGPGEGAFSAEDAKVTKPSGTTGKKL
jgi:hypothetical protein